MRDLSLYMHLTVSLQYNTDHDNEEEIYFPFLEANGAKFPEAKGMVMSHKELVEALQQMKMIFETILDKEGQECLGEIAILKKKVPSFAKDMFGTYHPKKCFTILFTKPPNKNIHLYRTFSGRRA